MIKFLFDGANPTPLKKGGIVVSDFRLDESVCVSLTLVNYINLIGFCIAEYKEAMSE